ncbi:MAG TPA: helix-turn-helix transcriptional regulator [Gaiellaceae bacterium]
MRIACRLRELRQARELSLRDVERMTGIARTDLSKVERGRMLPPDR